MDVVSYPPGLHPIAADTWAYLRPPGTWGYSNSGLIVSGTQALLVDTQFTPALTERLVNAIAAAVPQVTITTVVNTHANGDHCWGNQLLPHAAIVAAASTVEAIADELTPDQLAAAVANTPDGSALGRYLRRYFAEFDFTGITVTPASYTFDATLDWPVGDRQVRLLEVGPAHTAGDVVVHVPDVGVVFSGDILFIGDHPIMWTGPIDNWVTACDRILATDATVFVPGHGPMTDRAGVAVFRSYLQDIGEQAERRFRAGMPYWQAAADIPLRAEYAAWGHPERLVITVAAIYRCLGLPDPPGVLEVLARTAEAAPAD